MTSRKNQKGGDQSTNIQTEQMVVHVGIDEKRAREVFQEMNQQLRQEYSREAFEVASARVAEFEDSLMPKMERVNGALEAFSDPSFQLLLVDAQKTAASTERPADYDLLSELLIHRFQKGSDRVARAGIGVAVDIVDKVSDDALLGLTAAHAVNTFIPTSGDPCQGLDVLNNLFGKILYGCLPLGQEWLDHLDVLNAVRLSSFGSMKKAKQYYSKRLAGYIDVGIKKDSDDCTKAMEILEANNLPRGLLVEHTFNTDFLRIPVSNRLQIESLTLRQTVSDGDALKIDSVGLSEDQQKAINSIYDIYSKDGGLIEKNSNAFMVEWEKRDNLKKLKEWWDEMPIVLTITSAGKVLAHSNAQRCDNSLPPMD